MQLGAVILAAGKGTRMKSKLPKVLHKVCGRPMVLQVIEAVRAAGIEKMVAVVGHGAEEVRQALGSTVEYAVQEQQLGTGHAVQQAEALFVEFNGAVLVLCGDTPLVTRDTVSRLIQYHQEQRAAATVLTALMEEPAGYGRIVRHPNGTVAKIVEDKDASEQERQIKEINTGAYCFNSGELFSALKNLTPANAQGEYYLTDTLEILQKQGKTISGMVIQDPREMMGINDRLQLAEAEAMMRKRITENLMREGVTILDPATTWIDQGVKIGADTVIYPNTVIEGSTVIGEDCLIGPGARLVDASLEQGVEVQYSIVLESTLGAQTTVGPYAYIRPGSSIGQGAKVGDFVEIKKSVIGNGSKVPHLSYIGDSFIGEQVNIGAGTITCNYDGKNKYNTTIGDGAFVGSNTNLVAPVEVGPGAIIAAGSTITKNVPGEALAVARSKQSNIDNWVSKKKKRD
ncbi:MAG: bifunctional UDP-N-acetylglucosamine diphosphorylase/glucosamine-1-phosphate N-acetyltransferase GlmU [Clostridia bacterium]|nr:bifunctional UDP-N-acetylglucosamine diphosphorylase/glucosamine-1-phosphate N-acetyltransferase GlmU [Clostridia bacterium]